MKRRSAIRALGVIAAMFIALTLFVACDTKICVVSFDLGGAEGTPPPEMSVEKGKEVTLPNWSEESDGFVAWQGHTFAGWICELDGKLYAPGDSYTAEENAKFVAKWKTSGASSDVDGYSVALSYDKGRGNVELTAPAGGGKLYAQGEQVTVTVTANDGYAANYFAVEGYDDAALTTDGKYTFTVKGNTIINVTFGRVKMSASVLASLQGSVRFEGHYHEIDYMDDGAVSEDTDELTVFDTEREAIWQRIEVGGMTFLNCVYVKNGETVAMVTHDQNGKLKLLTSQDLYDEFDNPFVGLTTNDFELYGDDEYVVADPKTANDISLAVTGYNNKVSKLTLKEQGGKIVAIDIVCERVTNLDNGVDYLPVYHYDVKEHGVAAVPEEWLADYREGEEHATLKAALEKAKQHKSYTIDYHSEEIGYESEPLDYHIYVTEDAIYEDCPGYENGYTVRGDGSVWSFDYDKDMDDVKFVSKQGRKTIADLAAKFVFTDISYSMLECIGNEQYRVREVDIFEDQYVTGATGEVAYYFAVGRDRQAMFANAFDITITLKDGELNRVDLIYSFYGITERVSMTFKDFDNTKQPYDFKDRSQWAAWVGSFTSGDGRYAFNITDQNVELTIDGEPQTVTVSKYDANARQFTLRVNGTIYYLYTFDKGEVNQATYQRADGGQIQLTRDGWEGGEVDPPVDPERGKWPAFVGRYKSADGRCEIAITADSVEIKIDGVKKNVESIRFDSSENYFAIVIEGEEYTLQCATYDDPISKIMFYKDSEFNRDDPSTYFYLSRV